MYSLGNALTNPFWVVTFSLALSGWLITFIGSIFHNVYYGPLYPKFYWWGVVYELLITMAIIHAVLSDRIYMYQSSLVGLVSIAAIYTTTNANQFVWGESWSAGMAAGGYIILSIVNFCWIVFLGTTNDEPLHHCIRKGVYRRRNGMKQIQ